MFTQPSPPLSGPSLTGLWHVSDNQVEFSTAISETLQWAETSPDLDALAYQAVQQKSPIIKGASLDDSEHSSVSIPIVEDGQVNSVVVMQFQEPVFHSSVMERWELVKGRAELSLSDGYYGELNHFQDISASVRFLIGQGLPGMTWKTSQPRLLQPLGTSTEFVRSDSAREEGLDIGLGFPVLGENNVVNSVLLLLSSQQIPFADEFQIWQEQENRCRMKESLICRMGVKADTGTLRSQTMEEIIEDLVAEAMLRKTALVEKIPEPVGDVISCRSRGIVVLPVLKGAGKSSALVMLTS